MPTPNRNFCHYEFNTAAANSPGGTEPWPQAHVPPRYLPAVIEKKPDARLNHGDDADKTFLESLYYWFPEAQKDPNHFANKISGLTASDMYTTVVVIKELYEESTTDQLCDLMTVNLVSRAANGYDDVAGQFSEDVDTAIIELRSVLKQKDTYQQIQSVWEMSSLAKTAFQTGLIADLDLMLGETINDTVLAPEPETVDNFGLFIFNTCAHGGMHEGLLRRTVNAYNDLSELMGSSRRLSVGRDGSLGLGSTPPSGGRPGSKPGVN